MNVPHFRWSRRHNLAVLTVSYSPRTWTTREAAGMLLQYSAAGRLARIVVLDPNALFPVGTGVRDALMRVTVALLREGACRQPDLDVLRSAISRAPAEELRDSG